ncbi:competence type IV pilus minor pilin ComGD [Bacillus sp. NPDC077027]|uniref:competence type IV pilus minor pilin ComGD n=1 Tax=Bacillus sp. NPDC077027 TaxID=3390548 RepID=UPI003CFCBDFB
MNNYVAQDKGFTLIEHLVMLLIYSILLTTVFTKVPSLLEDAKAKKQMTQMKQDLQLASYTAFATNSRVDVHFDEKKLSYKVMTEKGKRLITSSSDEQGYIKNSTFQKPLHFNPNGNPGSGGSFVVQYGKQSYKVTIYLGSGRIHVQKQAGI